MNGVPPTFQMDPSRPRSADFFQSPGYRGRIGGEGPPAPPSGLPPGMSGYMPGTPAQLHEAGKARARSSDAGAATGGTYGQVRDWSIAFARDYGAPQSEIDHLNSLDWNSGDSLMNAKNGLEYVLTELCQIPFGSGAAGVSDP